MKVSDISINSERYYKLSELKKELNYNLYHLVNRNNMSVKHDAYGKIISASDLRKILPEIEKKVNISAITGWKSFKSEVNSITKTDDDSAKEDDEFITLTEEYLEEEVSKVSEKVINSRLDAVYYDVVQAMEKLQGLTEQQLKINVANQQAIKNLIAENRTLKLRISKMENLLRR